MTDQPREDTNAEQPPSWQFHQEQVDEAAPPPEQVAPEQPAIDQPGEQQVAAEAGAPGPTLPPPPPLASRPAESTDEAAPAGVPQDESAAGPDEVAPAPEVEDTPQAAPEVEDAPEPAEGVRDPGAPDAAASEPESGVEAAPHVAEDVRDPGAPDAEAAAVLDEDTRIQSAVAAPRASSLISDELAPPLDEPTGPVEPPRPAVGEGVFRPEAALPVAGAMAGAAASQATPTEPDEATRELTEEERKLAAERAARREARQAALAASDAPPAAAPEPVVVHRRNTDRFAGSLGLFLLRLVTAAILLVRGLEIVTNLAAAQDSFAQTRIPEPRVMAIVTGVAALLIAVALVFGLFVRVAGLGVALIAIGALVFVLWGPWSPFVAGKSGFVGELELLLAAVGLLFVAVGGGGFGLDRSFRKSREKAKLAKQTTA